MLTVQRVALPGLIAHLAVLALLAGTVGLGPGGRLAGGGYALGTTVLLARAVARSASPALGPADLVTRPARRSWAGSRHWWPTRSPARSRPLLTALAVVALVLDAVDGRVARSTGTVSAVGARFDMEVDSALVLLLSVYVAQTLGPWVVAIGSVHYLLLVARRLLPWLRRPAPPRYWCKVVAAVQGACWRSRRRRAATGLAVRPARRGRRCSPSRSAARSGGSCSRPATVAGRDRSRDRRRRGPASRALRDGPRRPRRLGRARRARPRRPDQREAFLRIPSRGWCSSALGLLVPRRRIRVVAVGSALLIGLLAVVRILDLGFYEALHRPFNPVNDWRLLPPAIDAR